MSEIVSSAHVSHHFDRISACYDDAAELPTQVADLMLHRLDALSLTPRHVLDLGSGTGYCAYRLQQMFSQANVYAMDASLGMLAQQRHLSKAGTVVCGDCHHLPFLPGSFDLIVSNMALHWCQDIEAVLREVWSLLSPGGVFVCSLAGPGTFREWRQAWQSIDQYTHTLSFVEPAQFAQWLMSLGFVDAVVDSESWVMAYGSLTDIHRAMKNAGASMPVTMRQGLLGRRAYQRLCDAYEAYRDEAGYLPLSYEISMVYGRKAEQDFAADAHVSYVPVDQIKRI
jgi:malonyl-CoA O-methyltransferase